MSPLLVAGSALLAVRVVAPRSFETVRSIFARLWSAALRPTAPREALHLAADGTLRALVLPLGAVALLALVAIFAQTGGAWKTEQARRRVSSGGIAGVGALLALAMVLVTLVAGRPDTLGDLGDARLRARAALDALIGSLFATGLVDLLVRRWQWTRGLSRTPAEARREARDDEGDPYLRAARRLAHRMLLEETVPTRDWRVITDGRRSVVVAWRTEMDAPRVVLHAQGALFVELTRMAETQSLRRWYRPDLVSRLAVVPVGERLPRDTWETVASLIATG